jgi:pseudouridine-5'-phosphate glycosidase
MTDGLRPNVSDEVRAALDEGRPVVALESTLIAHGLPRPRNREVAHRLEESVRKGGGVPATIGVFEGRMTVGLDADQIQILASAENVRKCSRRDLPIAMARREHGATTVAGTLAVMELAGLRVLATGGIGGVHRGAETTFDISTDLAELARTPAIVVCAGAKAILDLPKTLELLETLGVPVVGWQTDCFPSFYSAGDGRLPVTASAKDADELISIVRAGWDSGLTRGLLLTAPPPPGTTLARVEAERALDEALRAADRCGLHGPAITPFLLDAVAKATEGRSVEANIALLENNARVATEVALRLSQHTSDEHAPGGTVP